MVAGAAAWNSLGTIAIGEECTPQRLHNTSLTAARNPSSVGPCTGPFDGASGKVDATLPPGGDRPRTAAQYGRGQRRLHQLECRGARFRNDIVIVEAFAKLS